MAYERSWRTSIKAPPEVVFEYLADVSRHVEWGSDMTKSVAEEAGPPAVGKRYDTEGTLNGKANRSIVTISAIDAPRRFAFDAEDANSVFHHEFTLSGDGGETQLDRRMTMTRGPFLNPVFMRIFQGVIDKNYNGALVKLKAKMETGSSA
jgi:carbon monoxide dehydrogenase subunit G